MILTNNAKRVAIIDRYYGNDHQPTLRVITTLDERGTEIASHELQEVANLSRVLQTISASHWYDSAEFSPDERFLIEKHLLLNANVLRLWSRPKKLQGVWSPFPMSNFALT